MQACHLVAICVITFSSTTNTHLKWDQQHNHSLVTLFQIILGKTNIFFWVKCFIYILYTKYFCAVEVVGGRRVPFVQACTLIKSIAVKAAHGIPWRMWDNMGLCLRLYKLTPRSFSSQPCLFQRQPQQNSGGLLLSLTGFGPRVGGVPKDPREAKYEIYSKEGGKHKICNNSSSIYSSSYHLPCNISV